MRIVIIGSGNLATQLSLALHDAGQDIVQVFSRTADHAKCLADKLGCTYTSDINAISPDADIYIISVKDDAIAEVAQAVGQSSPNALILHTAGSVAMSVLGSCASRYGVLYPMQTFSKTRRVDFREIPCLGTNLGRFSVPKQGTLPEMTHSQIGNLPQRGTSKQGVLATRAKREPLPCERGSGDAEFDGANARRRTSRTALPRTPRR